MIKGLAITPPAIGRISIGKVVEKNGKRLPEKDACSIPHRREKNGQEACSFSNSTTVKPRVQVCEGMMGVD